jgi:LPPG:FO 2-phospho-L-lactate transferase
VPCVVVSPIIGGKAVKGPAAKLLAELGFDVSPVGVVRHYEDLLNGVILDKVDRPLCAEIEASGVRTSVQQTLMETLPDKVNLAETLLHWSEENLLR